MIPKKIIVFVFFALASITFSAQKVAQKESPVYVDVFIYKNKDIRIEGDVVEFKDITNEVQKLILENPPASNEQITYRIFADKNLLLGYPMDVEHKMFEAYHHNTSRKRYLLETGKMKPNMEIDGEFRLEK
ncbi:MAG: hypothetical protein JKY48_05380 [Flavobacteriales bacterium]|nr:hypothetical protein [Flavobacteriales bacterium]